MALAERSSGRRPTASAEPPRGFRDPPQPPQPPRPPQPAPGGYYAAQRERNTALGHEVLASMMARRGEPPGVWMEG